MAPWTNNTANVTCLVLGAKDVGKSTLISLLTARQGCRSYAPCMDFYCHLPGDKVPTCFTMSFAEKQGTDIPDHDMIIFVYAVNDKDTLKKEEWISVRRQKPSARAIVLGLKTDLLPPKSENCVSNYEVFLKAMSNLHTDTHFKTSCVKKKQWIQNEFKATLMHYAVYDYCKQNNKPVQDPWSLRIDLSFLEYNAEKFWPGDEWVQKHGKTIVALLGIYLALHILVVLWSK